MPLLHKVDAVVGQGDVPLPGVGEADAQMLRQGLTESDKGVGVINELLAGYPRSQSHRRRGDHQDLASIQGDAREEPIQPFNGLFRTSALEQIVGPKHDDQQIGISRKVRDRRGNLPAVFTQVTDGPAGFLGQDIHPPAVRSVAATQIGAGVIAVCVGIAEADDVHLPFFLSLSARVSQCSQGGFHLIFLLGR